ncbi:MAG: sugar-binding transcriptional regulator [Marmoricola sp.]
MIKVARLYHTHGMRQTDIARRLRISQSRVSRLLSQAEEARIVRTVVAVPPHIHASLEEEVEQRYGVGDVHVIEAVTDDGEELNRDLAHSMATILQDVVLDAPVIGFTSWSKTVRMMVDALQPLRTRTESVVEMLGDLGPPALQHDAARSTQRLASLTGGEPVFLRTPGVVPSSDVKDLLLSRDAHARQALQMLDHMDLALVGIGAAQIDPVLRPGDNFFTEEQFERARALGAVGEVCLHFIDDRGRPIQSDLEDLVIGVSRTQLREAKSRWAVAGGVRKRAAVRAALAGGWVDTLVTDAATAEYLVSSSSSPSPLEAAKA